MFDIITIGGATRDVFFKTSKGKIIKNHVGLSKKLLAFDYGSKITPEEACFGFGGGAVNTAISFSKLDFKVATAISLGEEGTGDLIVSYLQKQGVDTRFVIRDKKEHTALSIIISVPSGDDRVIFVYPGANLNLKIKNWENISQTKWFYVTSLRGDSDKLLPKIQEIVARGKIKLAFNPGGTQLRKGYLGLKNIIKNTSILLLNRYEASQLALSYDYKINVREISNILKTIKNLGPEIVVVTDGKNGSYATKDGKIIKHAKIYNIPVLYMTGAGDAFGSTFTTAIILGYNLEKALKLANLNAAFAISKIGAQEGLLDLKDLKKKANFQR